MRLLVLGKSPAWPDPGGACSGYLLEQDGFTLLLDCGAGVLGKLAEVQDYLTLDAVLISHLHADHILDLIPFSYALNLSPRRGDPPRRPPLHAPPGSLDMFRRLGACWNDEDLLTQAFAVTEYHPSDPLEVGPFAVRFREVPHYTQAFACEFTAGGSRITFGADCGPNDALVEFAQDTDLLIVEASLREPDTDVPRGHMTPREAGEAGQAARARRLLVTHFSDELGVDWVRQESGRGYGSEVIMAEGGAELTV
ncbi:MAG TPA: MBL fold metallo-hydrolase [Solirubrobacteraceae bacterium]|jgi:ribonuclease BN (tRNA processing enzyme)|nr:MBL fold metallo-hydrolase [Solirubrobacteraceae bacterium]